MRFRLAIIGKHLSQCLLLGGAQYTYTLLLMKLSITMIIVSLSGFLFIHFLSLTWKLGKGLVI